MLEIKRAFWGNVDLIKAFWENNQLWGGVCYLLGSKLHLLIAQKIRTNVKYYRRVLRKKSTGRRGVLSICATFWDQNHDWLSAKKLEKNVLRKNKSNWGRGEGGGGWAFWTPLGIKITSYMIIGNKSKKCSILWPLFEKKIAFLENFVPLFWIIGIKITLDYWAKKSKKCSISWALFEKKIVFLENCLPLFLDQASLGTKSQLIIG